MGEIADPGFRPPRRTSPWAILAFSLRERLRREDGRGIPGPKNGTWGTHDLRSG
jgi:hypothetical protein